MSDTITETAPRLGSGTGTGPMKRHVVKKLAEGGVSEATLCGEPWDRLHPQAGEVCGACLAIYSKMRPGWPLPGSGA